MGHNVASVLNRVKITLYMKPCMQNKDRLSWRHSTDKCSLYRAHPIFKILVVFSIIMLITLLPNLNWALCRKLGACDSVGVCG